MEKAETVGGLLILAVGVVILVAASRLPYMVENVPGPGFLPLWLSFGILISGAIVTFNALRGRLRPGEPIPWPNTSGWIQVVVLMVALGLGFLFLDELGFVVTTALFMAIVIFSLGVRSAITLIVAPLAAAGILYAVFAMWLNVPLPQGWFAL